MTKEEILQALKENLKISDYYHDADLNQKIEIVINYIELKTGASKDIQLENYPYIVILGASDLYNYDKYQEIFLDLVTTISIYNGGANA